MAKQTLCPQGSAGSPRCRVLGRADIWKQRGGLVVAVVAAGAACAAIGTGMALMAMAVADTGAATVVTGPILRLRVLGSEKRRRHFMVVDDGSSPTIKAFVVDPVRYSRLAQGDVVAVEVTRALGSVRSIVPASETPDEVVRRVVEPLGLAPADE